MNDEKNKKDEILDKEPESVTREINLDELYDGAINSTVVIDPITNDEVLLRQKKSNVKYFIIILLILMFLILYFINNKMGVLVTAEDKKTTTKKIITTTTVKNMKGVLNCTYSSKSDTDNQTLKFIANYENNKIIDSIFDYAVVTSSDTVSDVIKNLMDQYEEFYINNASVTGNVVSFEKNNKGFTFNVKSDYSTLKFEDIKLNDGKTVLYVKPNDNDTVDNIKEAYINKGFTCNILDQGGE